MCGISGILSVADIKEAAALQFERVARKFISKRGPDNFSSLQTSQHVYLVHARLSLNDLDERSNQPFVSACGDYALVFNGEIYNFRKLRTELEEVGVTFSSSGDTEVLLEALIQFGIEDTLNTKIDGMYAFCFVDLKRHRAWIARDRFGEKPLYYLHQGGEIFFSSSQMHLAQYMGRSEVNVEAMKGFAIYGFIPPFCQLFEGIAQLSPGETLCFDLRNNNIETNQLCHGVEEDVVDNLGTLKERFADALMRSVDQCLRADVSVGVYLSSGLDSSVIALTARKKLDYDVETFTVGFDEEKDESSAVTKFCRQHGIRNSVCLVSSDMFWDMFLNYPDVYDTPMADTSCALISLLSKQASKSLRCVMGGDGADELFHGYPRYSRLAVLKRINRLGRFGRMFSGLATGKRFWKSMAGSDQELYARFMDITNGELGPMNHRVFDAQARNILEFDTRNYMTQNCLVKIDRATMHFGIEARSPFLSREFHNLSTVSGLERFQPMLKRKLLQRHVYSELSGQDYPGTQKFGFSAPYREWMSGPFYKDISNVVADGPGPEFKALQDRVDSFLSTPERLDANGLTLIWRYFCFKLFCNHFGLRLDRKLAA